MISFGQKLGWGLASLGVATALPVAVLEYKKRRAIQEIINEKLLLQFGYTGVSSENKYKKLCISFLAPYGIYDEKEKLHKPGTKKIAGTNLEKYLKSCCGYVGVSWNFKYVGDSWEASYLGDRCIDPLVSAERAWKNSELMEGSFGFFSQNASQIDANTDFLSKELLDEIPYYVRVGEVALYLMRQHSLHPFCSNSLHEFYSKGPDSCCGTIEPNGGIGILFNWVLTPWGHFEFSGSLCSTEIEDKVKSTLKIELTESRCYRGFYQNLFYENFYSVRKAVDGTDLPEIVESPGLSSFIFGKKNEEMEGNWKLIRDPVFLKLQRRDKGQIVRKEVIKEKIVNSIQSVYDSAVVVYGSVPDRVSLIIKKLKSIGNP